MTQNNAVNATVFLRNISLGIGIALALWGVVASLAIWPYQVSQMKEQINEIEYRVDMLSTNLDLMIDSIKRDRLVDRELLLRIDERVKDLQRTTKYNQP